MYLTKRILNLVILGFFGGFLVNASYLLAQGDIENGVPDSNIAISQPKILFTKSSMDFGQAFQGQKLTYSFNFENVGEAPLVIHGVHASCGCTAVEVEKGRPYQPGEKGTVEVSFDTSNFSGSITKVVTVMTNQKLTPDRTLVVRANVGQEIGVVPPLVDFGDLIVGETREQTVMIKVAARSNISVQNIKFNKDVLDAKLEPHSGTEWKLTVALKPTARPMFLKETVAVMNTSKFLKELSVPVRANIRNGVETKPDYLEFGAIARGDKIKRTLTITGLTLDKIKNAETTLHVNGDKVNDLVNFVTVDKGNASKGEVRFTIELKNQTKQPGNVHGRLLFKTDDAQTGEVPVDFYAFFR